VTTASWFALRKLRPTPTGQLFHNPNRRSPCCGPGLASRQKTPTGWTHRVAGRIMTGWERQGHPLSGVCIRHPSRATGSRVSKTPSTLRRAKWIMFHVLGAASSSTGMSSIPIAPAHIATIPACVLTRSTAHAGLGTTRKIQFRPVVNLSGCACQPDWAATDLDSVRVTELRPHQCGVLTQREPKAPTAICRVGSPGVLATYSSLVPDPVNLDLPSGQHTCHRGTHQAAMGPISTCLTNKDAS
jgi:hypothetical protein